MRIWSIHPKYLDTKRLTAQWREALLCKSILEGKTKSYTKHPQYLKLLKLKNPYQFINFFLLTIWEESQKRGYKYDKSKINLDEVKIFDNVYLDVTIEQLKYEFCHMLQKMNNDDPQYLKNIIFLKKEGIISNPLFNSIDGNIMNFEIIKENTLNLYKSMK